MDTCFIDIILELIKVIIVLGLSSIAIMFLIFAINLFQGKPIHDSRTDRVNYK